MAHIAWEKYIKLTQSNDTNTLFWFYFYVPAWRILPFLQELPSEVYWPCGSWFSPHVTAWYPKKNNLKKFLMVIAHSTSLGHGKKKKKKRGVLWSRTILRILAIAKKKQNGQGELFYVRALQKLAKGNLMTAWWKIWHCNQGWIKLHFAGSI